MVALDVTDRAAVAALPTQLPLAFANVTLLLNNAGLASGFCDVASYDLGDLEAMLDVNVRGLAACCRVRLLV